MYYTTTQDLENFFFLHTVHKIAWNNYYVCVCAYYMRDGTCVCVLAPCVCMVLYIGVRTQGRCKMTFLYDFWY